MDPLVEALTAQQAELAGLLDGLDETGWHTPTRCEGWDVADVVLHLAQSDEMARGSVTGRFAEVTAALTDGLARAATVDEGAALMVAGQRGAPGADLRRRWAEGAASLVGALGAMDLSTRVPWVAGDLSARTLATTRLAETWIHGGDVARARGTTLAATDRLAPIARLAWRTLPYAFASAGRTLAGPVAFRLVSPTGEPWDFLPDEPALTTVAGPALDLCEVAARRAEAWDRALSAEGPDAEAVLALVRTYA